MVFLEVIDYTYKIFETLIHCNNIYIYIASKLLLKYLEFIAVGGVQLMGLWDSEWGQDRWANGPSKTV